VTPRSADFVAFVSGPDLRLDFVILGQIVPHRDAGCLGEAVGDTCLQRIYPTAAPGANDDFGWFFRLLRKGAADAERRQAGISAGCGERRQQRATAELGGQKFIMRH
jgi:hypothetical protein